MCPEAAWWQGKQLLKDQQFPLFKSVLSSWWGASKVPDSTRSTLHRKISVLHVRAMRKFVWKWAKPKNPTFWFSSLGEKHLQSEGVAEVCHVLLEREQNRSSAWTREFITRTAGGTERRKKKTNGVKQVMMSKQYQSHHTDKHPSAQSTSWVHS